MSLGPDRLNLMEVSKFFVIDFIKNCSESMGMSKLFRFLLGGISGIIMSNAGNVTWICTKRHL